MAQRPTRSLDKGFTLVELLVTLAIALVIVGVAVPGLFGVVSLGNSAVADSDARNTNVDIGYLVNGYYTFGDDDGTITVNQDGYLVFSEMTNAAPFEATGPGTSSQLATLSDGSTWLTGTYGGGPDLHWCIAVQNSNEIAVYNEDGKADGAVTCTASGVPANS